MVTQRTRCSRVYRVAPHEGSNPSTKARVFHQGRRDLRRTGLYDAENRTTKYDRKSQETSEKHELVIGRREKQSRLVVTAMWFARKGDD